MRVLANAIVFALPVCATLSATCAAAQTTPPIAPTSSATWPYYEKCPDADPYVDALNKSLQKPEKAVGASGNLAGALNDCADRIRVRAAGEDYRRGHNDLDYVSWLYYQAAFLYMMSMENVWRVEKPLGTDRPSKEGANLIIDAARLALLDLKRAKLWPLGRSQQNDNFLRAVSELQIKIEGLVEQYVPSRSGEIYGSP